MAGKQRAKDEQEVLAADTGPDEVAQMDDDNESTGSAERAAQLGVTNGYGAEDGGDEEETQHTADDGDWDEGEEHVLAGDENENGEDYDFEDEDEPQSSPKRSNRRRHAQGEDDEDDESEDDNGEGEEDDDEESVADSEGVGAVKIRPGDTDEEDEDEDEEEESDAGSAVESESSDEEWDETAANDEDDEDDEEEEEAVEAEDGIVDAGDAEEEKAEAGVCLFCKKDATHGPDAETDNAFLACYSCTNTAHAACASEQNEAAPDGGASGWKCPGCQGRLEAGEAMEVDAENQPVNGSATTSALDANTSRDTPALRSSARAGDHAESSNSPRVLRKRKTSPVEAVDDGITMSLRKRRRNVAGDGLNDLGDAAEPGSVRSLRIKTVSSPLVTTVKKTRTSLVLKMRVPGSELQQICARKKRKYTKRGTVLKSGRKKKQLGAEEGEDAAGYPMLLPLMPSASSYTQPFYSFFDKETEEQKGKPYGGILTEAEADTSKTMPTADDRRRFDEAKQQAEAEWRTRLLAAQAAEADAQAPLSQKKKKAVGPASQIECIEFGGWEIDTWYAAPYPEEYSRNRVLYICEFCLKYMNSDYVAWRHKLKCPAKHPPGDEIYRHESVSMFEVDGRKNPVYCQNLCLLAKLFLGSKTLYYDVEPFLFYVLCEYDDFGYHFVGYFSKEKRASSQNNVSCILTLPIHQRKGYGNLLMDFSYLLTRVEKRTGSPEKPLSDMGLVSYRNYWRLEMCRYLLRVLDGGANGGNGGNGAVGLSIKKISDDTGMTADDVISALEGLRCLVRDPQTGLYAFRVDVAYCREYVAKWERKNYVKLHPEKLTWTPYVMGRSNASNFELGPALSAMAPREEDEEHKAAEAYIASLATNGLVNGIVHGSEAAHADGDGANGTDGAYPEANTVLESTERNDDEALPGQAKGGGEDAGHEQNDKADHHAAEGGDDDANGDPGLTAMANGDDGRSYTVQASTGPAGAGSGCGSGSGSGSGGGGLSVPCTESGRGRSASNEDWAAAYEGIPATRFVVYPPMTARGFNYARAPIGRPPGARTGSGSGTRGRRHGSVRRSSLAATGSANGSVSGRRKTGGTGRGPGRWPKGTKKSDYGNADSGPGLPPAWLSGDGTAAEDEKEDKQGEGAVSAVEDATEEGKETAPVEAAAPTAERPATTEAGNDGDAAKDTTVDVQTDVQADAQADAQADVQTPVKPNGVHLLATPTGSSFQSRSSPRLNKSSGGGGTADTAGPAPQDGEDTAIVDADA